MFRKLALSAALLLGVAANSQASGIAETPIPLNVLNQCISQSSQAFGIQPIMLKTIIAVEGGQAGTASRNTDGSYDMGVMQVNTIHLNDIQRELGYTWKDLIFNPCKNIQAGAWILSKRLKEEPSRPWLAVGNYHSKTPGKRVVYLKKIANAYAGLYPVIGTSGESKALGRTTNFGRAGVAMAAQDSPVTVFTDKGVPSLAALEQSISGGSPAGFSTPMAAQTPMVIKKRTEIAAITNKRKILRFIE
ncbi:lytic transglycosylase domain-containing protein [Pseudomonas fluorescens]|nr:MULTISPECIES: lytic transglycosylase domain-containing protein [Pseudomonas]MBD8089278.1 lytic transglycosylase domain-containing protein [Pseudomonas fluorescens]MBD8682051.1 lytic transglycosylase domain-containing protein [Pseudomonas sp. CFBP 13719]